MHEPLSKIQPMRRLPVVIGVVGYLAGFLAAYQLVRGDLDNVMCFGASCYFHTGPWKFWFIMPLVPAALAWLVARRLLNGPRVTHEEDTMLFFAPPLASPTRGAAATVSGLLAALSQIGYTLRAYRIDAALRPVAPADGSEPLVGSQFLIKEAKVPARLAYLRLTLSATAPAGRGIIEIYDTTAGIYVELASFIVQCLAPVLPDLKFRRLNSSLPPTAAGVVSLPPRPQRLPAA